MGGCLGVLCSSTRLEIKPFQVVPICAQFYLNVRRGERERKSVAGGREQREKAIHAMAIWEKQERRRAARQPSSLSLRRGAPVDRRRCRR